MRSAKSGATPSESVHAIAESTLHWRLKLRRSGRLLPSRSRRDFCSAVGSVTRRSRISRPSVVGRTMSPLCSLDKSARTSVRLHLFLAGRFHRGRSPLDAELESSPIVAPLDCDFSTAPWPWSFPGASEPLPSGSRNAPGWLSLFPDDPPCDRECKFPRPAEWLPSLLPLRAAPASSPLSPVPLQTASSAGGVCPPDIARRACGLPPGFPHSRYPDRISRSCAPSHICAPPCAGWFPPSRRRRGCRRTSHS